MILNPSVDLTDGSKVTARSTDAAREMIICAEIQVMRDTALVDSTMT